MKTIAQIRQMQWTGLPTFDAGNTEDVHEFVLDSKNPTDDRVEALAILKNRVGAGRKVDEVDLVMYLLENRLSA